MRGRNSAGVEFHALLRAHQISSMNRFSRQDIVRRREPGMCGPACLDTRYEFGAEAGGIILHDRSEEHTSELQSLMRISYAVFCLKKKKQITHTTDKLNSIQTQKECNKYMKNITEHSNYTRAY